MSQDVIISTFCIMWPASCISGDTLGGNWGQLYLMPERVQPAVSLSNARKHWMLGNPLDVLVVCARMFYRRTLSFFAGNFSKLCRDHPLLYILKLFFPFWVMNFCMVFGSWKHVQVSLRSFICLVLGKIVVIQDLLSTFCLMAVINEMLELGVWNFKWR